MAEPNGIALSQAKDWFEKNPNDTSAFTYFHHLLLNDSDSARFMATHLANNHQQYPKTASYALAYLVKQNYCESIPHALDSFPPDLIIRHLLSIDSFAMANQRIKENQMLVDTQYFNNWQKEYTQLKSKNPWPYTLSSSVIPGSGKMLLNQGYDGLVSLLIITNYSALTWLSYNLKQSITPFVAINASLAAIFYAGNVVGTHRAAKRESQYIRMLFKNDLTQNLPQVYLPDFGSCESATISDSLYDVLQRELANQFQQGQIAAASLTAHRIAFAQRSVQPEIKELLKLRNLFLEERYENAIDKANSLISESSDTLSQSYLLTFAMLSYLQLNQLNSAKEVAAGLINLKRIQDTTLLKQQIKEFHSGYKNPTTAKILSAILPGAGQWYAKSYKNAANALVLNGLLIGGMIYTANIYNWPISLLFWFIPVPKYYLSNIQVAAQLSKDYNDTLKQQKINNMLKLIR